LIKETALSYSDLTFDEPPSVPAACELIENIVIKKYEIKNFFSIN
jgi:hypothetical protein